MREKLNFRKRLHNLSLRRKVLSSFVAMSVTIILIICMLIQFQFAALKEQVSNASDDASKQIGQTSQYAMSEEVYKRLNNLVEGKAAIADDTFNRFLGSLEIIANDIAYCYDNGSDNGADGGSENSAQITAQPPDPANDGTDVAQLLFARGVSRYSEGIPEELSLLDPVDELLLSTKEHFALMSDDYYSTESGITIIVDSLSGSKTEQGGEAVSLDLRDRPWYTGAAESGEPFFTQITEDMFTGRQAIMCGVPVYRDTELKGVVGAGMFLNDIDEQIHGTKVGDKGFSIIVDNNGNLLFSSAKEGSLEVDMDSSEIVNKNLLNGGNSAFVSMLQDGMNGYKGHGSCEIDGTEYFMAYAPMDTIGWTYAILLPRSEAEQLTESLTDTITDMSDNAKAEMASGIKAVIFFMFVFMIGLLALSVVASLRLSSRIVKPIIKLTEKVQGISGDNLNFHWKYHTGDEIQVLAESFGNLVDRSRQYIEDITAVTVEKERIGAELNVATQIQADMLPSIFPPYPDKKEFDLYASMNPAKEVGGDFYDFFLIDDDHLCMVMADVSGKGVPAALFMVIAKTLLKNQAQQGGTPAEILAAVNDQLCEGNKAEMFVTVWLGILEIPTGVITAANGGHEYPAVRKADGNYELFRDKHGLVLGGMEGIRYKDYTLKLERGDCLFLYTDGVPEATSRDKELFGTERMLEALNMYRNDQPDEILKGVRREIDKFIQDAPQFDDITMLDLVYHGTDELFAEITVDADTAKLADVTAFLDEHLEEYGIGMKEQMQFEMAVEELFTNVASYAYAPDKGSCTIGIRKKEDTVEIRMIDSGAPFDPTKEPKPDTSLSAEDRKIGGLGIYMVRRTMDEFHYERADDKNIVTMAKKTGK